MNSYRILHILSQTGLTGAEVHAITLCEQQQKIGNEIFVISENLTVPWKGDFTRRPIHSAKGLLRIQEIFFVAQFIKKNKIDVIHAHSRASTRIAFWASRLAGIPLVSTVHGRQHWSWGKKLFDTYGERIVSVSENIKQHLIQDFGIKSEKIVPLGNPVAFPAYNEEKRNRDIFLGGRWTGPKGENNLWFLKNALIPLVLKHPDYPWKISISLFGLEDATAEIKSELARIQKQFSNWQWIETFLPRPIDLYQDHDLVIGSGRIAIEALGCGSLVFALGEASCHGLINAENFKAAVLSNFGDVTTENSLELNASEILNTLNSWFNTRNNSAESKSSPDNESFNLTQRKSLAEKTRTIFAVEKIAACVQNLYQLALVKRRCSYPIPILMYHQVVDKDLDTPHKIYISKKNFKKQMSYLHNNGFTSYHFKDLQEIIATGKSYPQKSIMITFDDGYLNNLENALPILEQYKTKATIFLLADANQRSNSWDQGQVPESALMNAEQRKRLAAHPLIEIGSHGFHHKKMSEMSNDQIKQELVESKKSLEQEFTKPIMAYAFTYGILPDQPDHRASDAGYQFAVNTDQGGLHWTDNLFSLFRINIFPNDTGLKFWKKIQPWYRLYYFWKRKK